MADKPSLPEPSMSMHELGRQAHLADSGHPPCTRGYLTRSLKEVSPYTIVMIYCVCMLCISMTGTMTVVF